ncbi:TIGR00266 family protein [Cetobacterium sp. 8H]|uniref:TIGR00266 family protein n=1 Tax=Cetobacterium sp. 8H TaxID=2759681 RepID=UPI00163C1E84|nr:TIGR00266 family protein [Cetobacterium sp. 8H]MBC2851963.1 TIGR00266 family protein [Cetobacterium sp. 8H]
MKINQTSSTSASLVEFKLEKNESIRIEPGCMVYKDNCINLEGKINGGLFAAIGKAFLGGESFFTSIATAKSPGRIAVAPKGFGNIKLLNVTKDNQWYINDGSFLACNTSVDYTSSRQKRLLNSILGSTGGFFILKSKGEGELLVNGFGDLIEIDLDGSQPFQIDNGHVVCWQESLDYKLEIASGLFGFKSGEGLLNTFKGKGKVIIQTRNIQSFVDILVDYIPFPKNNK